MADPGVLNEEMGDALALLAREAEAYAGGLGDEPVLDHAAAEGLIGADPAPARVVKQPSPALELVAAGAGRRRRGRARRARPAATRSSGWSTSGASYPEEAR